MLIVKLTILGIVLLVMMIIFINIAVSMCDNKTKLEISFGKFPKWYTACCTIVALLFIFDIIGMISSIIYLLFVRW